MKILITIEELNNKKSRDLIPCECAYCHNTFSTQKNVVQRGLKGSRTIDFCTPKCGYQSKIKKQLLNCQNCQKPFLKDFSQIKKSKNHFCCHSCSGTWGNSHKTKGTNRSKLEFWLEKQLPVLYPNLIFKFNDTNVINVNFDLNFL